jgi:hypothetical protein
LFKIWINFLELKDDETYNDIDRLFEKSKVSLEFGYPDRKKI